MLRRIYNNDPNCTCVATVGKPTVECPACKDYRISHPQGPSQQDLDGIWTSERRWLKEKEVPRLKEEIKLLKAKITELNKEIEALLKE